VTLKYYIGTKPGIDGNYTVHRHDCPLLPDHGRRILMGIFRSPSDAIRGGRLFHTRLVLCPFCLKDHKEFNSPAYIEAQTGPDLIGSAMIKSGLTDVLVCAVN